MDLGSSTTTVAGLTHEAPPQQAHARPYPTPPLQVSERPVCWLLLASATASNTATAKPQVAGGDPALTVPQWAAQHCCWLGEPGP